MDTVFHLDSPPIVEAVLDIDCDLPPTFVLENAESGIKTHFQKQYPRHRRKFFRDHQVSDDLTTPLQISVKEGLEAINFSSEKGNQIVQFRKSGYSFNRLAPYDGLDAYLPEIERTWNIFLELVRPVCIRKIGLRTINRIPLPLDHETDSLDLDLYFNTAPQLPEGRDLRLSGFTTQLSAIDSATNSQIGIVLTPQPVNDGSLPIILDISVGHQVAPGFGKSWEEISSVVSTLRNLKNCIFKNILTEKCLKLFSIQG